MSSSICLEPQDVIALVCTGSPCQSELDLNLVTEYFQSRGFRTVYQKDTYKNLNALERAEIFFYYLSNDDIKVIWSVRGGEGTADIIPYLEKQVYQIKHFKPKLLIGFSDFTPLLVYFYQRFKWPVLHGLGARQLPFRMVNKKSEEITLNWLQGGDSIIINEIIPLNHLAYMASSITAPVMGGNLTLLQISINDIWQFNAANKIILLEEVNEEPYRVARTLKYLKRISFFEGAKAVLLAGFDFSKLNKNRNMEIHRSMENVFRDFAVECTCPVVYTVQIGHGQINYPIPFYLNAVLTLGVKPSLKFIRN